MALMKYEESKLLDLKSMGNEFWGSSYFGMYNNTSESIKQLLEQQDATLDDFLNDEGLVSELKTGNEKLILLYFSLFSIETE